MESINKADTVPESSVEVAWLLLSLLAIEPDHQVRILGGIPHAHDPRAAIPSRNNASLLLGALERFHVSWLDEFESCPYAKELFNLVGEMDCRQSIDSFKSDRKWIHLRELAKLALLEVGLEPWPMPDKIDLEDFFEIVYSEDIPTGK